MRSSRVALVASACVLGSIVAACGDGPAVASKGDAGGGSGGSGTAGGGNGSSGSQTPIGTSRSGEGTYYDADGTGACSFDASPGAMDVAALNVVDWDGSALCGACAAVTGPKGKVTVRIVDQCPGCKSGDLDLSEQAFVKIAAKEAGRVPITWSVVPCAVAGNVRYRFKDGSSEWWAGIQVLDHRLPIAKLEWKRGGAWTAVTRQSYNYFVQEGMGKGPLAIRITAATGESREDELPTPTSDGVIAGKGQL